MIEMILIVGLVISILGTAVGIIGCAVAISAINKQIEEDEK